MVKHRNSGTADFWLVSVHLAGVWHYTHQPKISHATVLVLYHTSPHVLLHQEKLGICSLCEHTYVYTYVAVLLGKWHVSNVVQVSDKEQHCSDPTGGVKTCVHGALPGLPGIGQVHAQIWGLHNCSRSCY